MNKSINQNNNNNNNYSLKIKNYHSINNNKIKLIKSLRQKVKTI